MGSLRGRNYVITGASSGIGAACARRLSREGATVTLAARREDLLAGLAAGLPGEAAWIAADVARGEDMAAVAALAEERFGRIDGVVCNAGIMPSSAIGQGRVGDWERMIDVNVKGVLHSIHAALPALLCQDFGRIIAISSVAAFHVRADSPVYAATKAAVRMICEGLRQELANRAGVTVIYPGAVATDLAATLPDVDRRVWLEKRLREQGLSPDDIADAVYYVFSRPRTVSINEMVIRPSAVQ